MEFIDESYMKTTSRNIRFIFHEIKRAIKKNASGKARATEEGESMSSLYFTLELLKSVKVQEHKHAHPTQRAGPHSRTSATHSAKWRRWTAVCASWITKIA